jgi:hypothetical protein
MEEAIWQVVFLGGRGGGGDQTECLVKAAVLTTWINFDSILELLMT